MAPHCLLYRRAALERPQAWEKPGTTLCPSSAFHHGASPAESCLGYDGPMQRNGRGRNKKAANPELTPTFLPCPRATGQQWVAVPHAERGAPRDPSSPQSVREGERRLCKEEPSSSHDSSTTWVPPNCLYGISMGNFDVIPGYVIKDNQTAEIYGVTTSQVSPGSWCRVLPHLAPGTEPKFSIF